MNLFDQVVQLARGQGLRAAVTSVEPEDAMGAAQSVALLATTSDTWAAFRSSPEAACADHPMDTWSLRVATEIARALGGRAVGPNEGPPWPPFLAWAKRAEPVWPSPIGMLVHAEEGLWVSYRAAVLFDAPAPPVSARIAVRPCDTCRGRPCLSVCPVGAFTDAGYDVAKCASWVASSEGERCRTHGCRARHVCPAGERAAPTPARAAFHMAAFLRSRAPTA